jgi:hypothetical protein
MPGTYSSPPSKSTAQSKGAPSDTASFPGTLPKSCTPVVPKNAVEVLMIEGASHKNVCWSRNPDGLLIATAGTAPNGNYKVIVPSDTNKVPSTTKSPRLEKGAALEFSEFRDRVKDELEYKMGVIESLETDYQKVQMLYGEMKRRLDSGQKVADDNGNLVRSQDLVVEEEYEGSATSYRVQSSDNGKGRVTSDQSPARTVRDGFSLTRREDVYIANDWGVSLLDKDSDNELRRNFFKCGLSLVRTGLSSYSTKCKISFPPFDNQSHESSLDKVFEIANQAVSGEVTSTTTAISFLDRSPITSVGKAVTKFSVRFKRGRVVIWKQP